MSNCDEPVTFKNHDATAFTFGRYKGRYVDEIDDLDYLYWTLDHLEGGHGMTEAFGRSVEARVEELEGGTE